MNNRPLILLVCLIAAFLAVPFARATTTSLELAHSGSWYTYGPTGTTNCPTMTTSTPGSSGFTSTVAYPHAVLVQGEVATGVHFSPDSNWSTYQTLQMTYKLTATNNASMTSDGKDVEFFFYDDSLSYELETEIGTPVNQTISAHLIADGASHTLTLDLTPLTRKSIYALELDMDFLDFAAAYSYSLNVTSLKLIGATGKMFDGQPLSTALAAPTTTTVSDTLTTANYLKLNLNNKGAVVGLGKAATSGGTVVGWGNNAVAGGFLVRDNSASSVTPTQLGGTVSSITGGYSVVENSTSLHLNTTCNYTLEKGSGSNDMIHVAMSATNTTTTTARYLTYYFALPLATGTWTWAIDPIDTAATGTTFGVEDVTSLYPIATLTGTSGSNTVSLALAVPLDKPRNFRLVYNENSGIFYVAFDVAMNNTTAAAGGNFNTATCDVYLYAGDPNWPFRSALQTYYNDFPALFTQHTGGGGWTTDSAGYQAGLRFDWGQNPSSPEWIANNSAGVLNLVYTEPILVQVPMMNVLASPNQDYGTNLTPSNATAASRLSNLASGLSTEWSDIATLNYVTSDTPAYWTGTTSPTRPQDYWDLISSAAVASGIKNIYGTTVYQIGYHDFVQNAQTTTTSSPVSVPLGLGTQVICNLDPLIPGGRGQVAMEMLQTTAAAYQTIAGTAADGWALDSFSVQACNQENIYDFNATNFTYSPFPLTFQRTNGQATYQTCVPVKDTAAAWLQSLVQQSWSADKVQMGNFGGCNVTFQAPYIDIFGDESPQVNDGAYVRMLANNRAITFLPYDAQPADVVYYHLLYDIYPGRGLDPSQYPIMLPTLDTLNAAGWQPVTYATPSAAGIRVERYGSGGTYYLVCYNTTASTVSFNLTVGSTLGTPGRGTEIFQPTLAGTIYTPSGSVFALSLGAGKISVLKVENSPSLWTATPIGTNGDQDVLIPASSTQTLLAAIAFSRNYDDATTLNTVAFSAGENNDVMTAVTYSGVVSTVTGLSTAGSYDYINHNTYDTGGGAIIPAYFDLSANYHTLLVSALAGNSSTPNGSGDCLSGSDTITVNGLTVGKMYIVRIWCNYNQGATPTTVTLSSGTGAGQYITASEGNGAAGSNGNYFTTIFTATATAKTFGFGSPGIPMINGIEVIQQN
jgi:hypothetical protein